MFDCLLSFPAENSFHPLCEAALTNATQIDGVSGKKFAGNKIKNAEGDRKSDS